MTKPLIAIDLDNVLALSAEGFVAFSNRHFGTAMTLRDYSEDWAAMWGVSHEEAERRGAVMRQERIHLSYQPAAGAKTALTALKAHYELVILTSRRQATEAYTRTWLDQHYPGIFDRIVFSGFFEAETGAGHLLTKGQQYKELGAAFVIDDHLKHCESAIEAGVQAILFGDYPWNQSDGLPDGVTRCIDWAEVAGYFDSPATLTRTL